VQLAVELAYYTKEQYKKILTNTINVEIHIKSVSAVLYVANLTLRTRQIHNISSDIEGG
jgi:hypothetical protein